MSASICFILFVVSSVAIGGDHREHGAHVHGSGTIAIAFDGLKGEIELRAPAESIYGFEHFPKNKKQEKAVDDSLLLLEKQIGNMVEFAPVLKCAVAKKKIHTLREPIEGSQMKKSKKAHLAQHAEVIAGFTVTCEKSPVGSQIVFNVQKHFPKLKDVDVTILADRLQKSAEAGKNGVIVDLK